MDSKHIIKLDVDDIMEILLEHYQEMYEDCECARGILLGTPENELRFVAVFGHLDDGIENIDLEQVDKKIDYNGDHSFLKNNPDFNIK